MESVKDMKEKVKKLAEEFGLKFDDEMFNFSVISKEDYVKLVFVLGCPMESYTKFGTTIEERSKRFEEFVRSEEFSEESKKVSGTVVEKEYADMALEKVDGAARQEFERIIEIIGYSFPQVAVLTEPGNDREKNAVFSQILFHEWIHILLRCNNIGPETQIRPTKDRISAHGNLHEGLTSYMQIFLTSSDKDFRGRIETKLKKIKAVLRSEGKELDEYTTDVFDKTLFWNDLLKDKKTPEERLKVIVKHSNQIV